MEELNRITEQLKAKFIETNDVQSLSLLMELQLVIFKWLQEIREETAVTSAPIQVADTEEKAESEKITFHLGCYYKGANGPFCPRCWETQDLWVLMEVVPRKVRKKGAAHCPNCEVVLLHQE